MNSLIKAVICLAMAPVVIASARAEDNTSFAVHHVVLISIDGLRQADLNWYAAHRPDSTLARLVREGRSYTNAWSPFPSDSVPGLLAQVTGGLPRTTGVYYDDSYSRRLLPVGTTDCSGTAPGTEVPLIESLDRNPNRLDAGENIPGPYAAATTIALLTGQPGELLDPGKMPVDPETCTPLYPHQYLRTNTIFEIAHSHGLRTAWSDKHPAYEFLNGPSGSGVDDVFAPEINGLVAMSATDAGDFTDDNIQTQHYDNFKVEAVLNWIHGHDHSGHSSTAVPAILGMNFQSVSTAQKLNFSNYRSSPNDPADSTRRGLGGYDPSGLTPRPVLLGALSYVDQQLARIVAAIDPNTTALIVSAKHGQSPPRRKDLVIINNNAMIQSLNSKWALANPNKTLPLVAHDVDDDGVVLWLNERSAAALDFVLVCLKEYNGWGVGSDSEGNPIPKAFTQAGLKRIYTGQAAADFLMAKPSDDRVPDLIGIAKQGTVWAGDKLGKIAEHGGDSQDDRHVPILIWGKNISAGKVTAHVQTTQIAPTILSLLRLPVRELQAVKRDHVALLPGIQSATSTTNLDRRESLRRHNSTSLQVQRLK